MKFIKRKRYEKTSITQQPLLSNIEKLEVGSFILILDREGVIVDFKGNVTETNQITQVGHKYSDYLSQEESERYSGYMHKALAGTVQHFSCVGKQNGIDYAFNITMFPFSENPETVTGLYCMLQNIRSLGSRNGTDCNEVKDHLYVDSRELSGILDVKGDVQYISPTVTSILGYEAYACTGRPFKNFIAKDEQASIEERWTSLLKVPNATIQGEIKVVDAQGLSLDFSISATNYLTEPSINGILFTCKDIQEIKKRDKKIHYLTNHDQLTGLPNRKVFLDELDIELNLARLSSAVFAVFVLKIQDFKNMNSAFGHDFGDHALLSIASQLQEKFGETIELMGRSSSNEFVIMTKYIKDKESAAELATVIQDVFNKPILINEQELAVSTSLGIALYPEAGSTSKELLKNASAALHACSGYGKNNYQFYSYDTNDILKKEFELNNDIASALAKGQFELYFQPIYQAHSNRIACTEALIRWNHPKYGIVPPLDFIGLVERTGEILPIGEWVMDTACRTLSEWHRANFKIKMAVNVSAIQFSDDTLPEVFYEITQTYNLDPKWIEIEITESALLDQHRIPVILEQLQEMGFGIVLDDFGTGYNSLKSLNDLKPEKIKVDRSFVEKLLIDDRSETITTSIIWMAKMLSVQVVAEGVETVEQSAFLKELGCGYFQGYLYSRPVSAETMTKLLKKQYQLEDSREGQTNRRNYFRVKLDGHFKARMTINEVNGKKIDVGIVNILIGDIGPGGLFFISTVDLPMREDVVLKFTIDFFNQEYHFFGRQVYSRIEQSYFGYGVSFEADERTRNTYIQLFNRVEVRLNQPNAYKDLPLLEGRMQSFLEASNLLEE